MKKVIYLVLFLSLLLSLFAYPASANESTEDYTSTLIDRDDNLTTAEEQRISEKLRWAEDETDITFIIGLYNISEGIPSGERVISNLGLDINSNDIVLLIIEVGNNGTLGDALGSTIIPGYSSNYYEMFTWGVANTVITDDSVDSILDHSDVYDNIKGAKFCDGAVAFIEQSVGCIKSYRRGIVFAIVIATVASAAVAVGAVILTYKKKLKSPIYPLSNYANLNLTEHTDVFLGKTVTRTRINTSSGSSGGGRSGGGGGGSRGRR